MSARWRSIAWSAALVALVVANPVYRLVVAGVEGADGLFNDFAIYWLASRVLSVGGSPYDLDAVVDLGIREGIDFDGPGYVYPLPFAIAMFPFAALPFEVAAWVFTVLSFVVFAATAVVWLRTLHGPGIHPWLVALAAYGAGCYPAITGSLYFGQANLFVFGLLGFGLYPLLAAARQTAADDGSADDGGSPRRPMKLGAAAGAALGVAAVVKLVPLVLVVPLALARRWRAVAGLALGALAPVALAALLAPAAVAESSRLSYLFAPDAYWTNQSINGFATRFVSAGDRTEPVVPGLVDPVLLNWALTGLLALATLLVLWRARASLARPDALAAAVALALAAAIAGAPKDSLWNYAPALLCVGLFVASLGRRGLRALDVGDVALLVAWYAAAVVQWRVNDLDPDALRSLGAVGTLLASTALYGLLALWFLFARRLARVPSGATERRAQRSASVPASARGA